MYLILHIFWFQQVSGENVTPSYDKIQSNLGPLKSGCLGQVVILKNTFIKQPSQI